MHFQSTFTAASRPRPASAAVRARHPLARPLAASVLLAVAGLLVACDSRDEAAAAIREASVKIQSLTAGGQHIAVTPQERKARFDEVLRTVQPLTSSQSKATAFAASTLAARAKSGLADLDALEGLDAEAAAAREAVAARAALDQYLAASAGAVGLAYDPAADLAALDARRAELEKELAAAAAQARQARDAVQALQARAADLLAQAQARRSESAQIRAGADGGGGGSQVQALQRLEQATVVSRAADALDQQASMVQAEVRVTEPLAAQQQALVDSLQRQRDRVDAEKDRVRTLAKTLADQAAQARALAAASGAQAEEALARWTTARAAAVAKWEAAAKGYEAAAGSARTAAGTGGDVASARLAQAGYLQALGDAQAALARLAASEAALLRSMAAASPALPGAAAHQSAGADAAARLTAAATAAVEAYGQAKELLEQAAGAPRVSDDTKAKLDAIGKSLAAVSEQLTAAAGIKPAEKAPEAAPAPAPAPESAPAPAADNAAVEAEVRAFLARLDAASKAGDAAALASMIHASDAEKPLADAVVALAAAQGKLDQACVAKLGQGAAQLAPSLAPFDSPVSADSAALTITVDSAEAATVAAAGGPAGSNFKLRKVGGNWGFDLKSLASPEGAPPLPPTMLPRLLGGIATLMTEAEAKVSDGSIKSGPELEAFIQQRLGPLMMQIMSQPDGK